MSFIFSPSEIYAPFVRFQNCQESKIIFKLAVATLNRARGENRMHSILATGNWSGSARVFGYTVYRGFLSRVYGILQLKYGYSVYHFLWISGIKYTYFNFGYIWMNFGYFWVFWRMFFGYTGIPLPTPPPPPPADPDWLCKAMRRLWETLIFLGHSTMDTNYRR